MAKLKRLKNGEPFPRDFWNYNINPIVGYDDKETCSYLDAKKARSYHMSDAFSNDPKQRQVYEAI